MNNNNNQLIIITCTCTPIYQYLHVLYHSNNALYIARHSDPQSVTYHRAIQHLKPGHLHARQSRTLEQRPLHTAGGASFGGRSIRSLSTAQSRSHTPTRARECPFFLLPAVCWRLLHVLHNALRRSVVCRRRHGRPADPDWALATPPDYFSHTS